MKKLLLYLLLAAGIAACSKDDDNQVPDVPTPPVTEHLSIVAGTPGLSGNTLTVADAESDSEAELTLAGVSGSVTATVDPVSVQWLSAEVKSEPVEEAAEAAAEEGAEKDTLVWKVILRAKAYTGNDDRVGFVTVESGNDAIQVKVFQGGRGKKIRMVVVNEGQFTKGTAALSAIAYDGTTDFDIFRTVNKKPLGDVAQSITYIDGKYFVAINNSKQIAVVEPQTFKLVETIDYEQDGKPRFIAQINENEAIVSDLVRQLVRIDIKNYKVIEHIDISAAVGVNGGVEKMTVVGKKLFCATQGGGKGVGVFDTDGEISGESMRFVEGFEGSIMKTCKMIEDKNGKLWVLATGKGGVLLNRIDPATEKVDKTVSIPYAVKGSEEYVPGAIVGTSFYTRWDTDRTRAKLYFFMNMLVNEQRGTSIGAIYTLDVDKDEIDPEPYRELPGLGMMYGMNISPDGDVFVCDCLDYTAQRGFLREYKADGSVDSRRVGVYPRMVHFTEYDKE